MRRAFPPAVMSRSPSSPRAVMELLSWNLRSRSPSSRFVVKEPVFAESVFYLLSWSSPSRTFRPLRAVMEPALAESVLAICFLALFNSLLKPLRHCHCTHTSCAVPVWHQQPFRWNSPPPTYLASPASQAEVHHQPSVESRIPLFIFGRPITRLTTHPLITSVGQREIDPN